MNNILIYPASVAFSVAIIAESLATTHKTRSCFRSFQAVGRNEYFGFLKSAKYYKRLIL